MGKDGTGVWLPVVELDESSVVAFVMAREQATEPSPGVGDGLATSLHAHSQFFDHLVELVPPKYYHDLDRDRVSTKYMKKADKAAAKQAFRKQATQVTYIKLM